MMNRASDHRMPRKNKSMRQLLLLFSKLIVPSLNLQYLSSGVMKIFHWPPYSVDHRSPQDFVNRLAGFILEKGIDLIHPPLHSTFQHFLLVMRDLVTGV